MNSCVRKECRYRQHGNVLVPCSFIQAVSDWYTIPDVPVPLKRPRFFKNKVYDAQKHLKLVKGIELKNQHQNKPPFAGILHFDINFYFALPKKLAQKNKLMLQQYHIYRPDLSNLIKMVEDLCVDCGIIHDDCIISSVFSRKVYDEGDPRTEFIITQIQPLEGDNHERENPS